MKYLLIDADDTVLDWIGAFKKFLDARGIKTNSDSPMHWSLHHWIPLPEAEVKNLVIEFNSGDWFTKLPALPHAKKVLNELKKDFKIVVITSCSRDQVIVDNRRLNLENEFGKIFTDIHCLNFTESKSVFLKEYPGSYFVDDKFENLITSLEFNHKPLLMAQPLNATLSHEKIIRVNCWNEIHSLIKKDAA